MKHHGNVSHFIYIRNRELYKAYRHALAGTSHIVLRDICRTVAETPCPRFWVSEERALIVVSELYKGRYVLDSMKPLTREMYIEIFRRVDSLRSENPNTPLYDLVFQVVNSPAPKFYLTPESVAVIICHIKKGRYKMHPTHPYGN